MQIIPICRSAAENDLPLTVESLTVGIAGDAKLFRQGG